MFCLCEACGGKEDKTLGKIAMEGMGVMECIVNELLSTVAHASEDLRCFELHSESVR